jgi:TrmH family RNA methyltransferase
MITSPHNDKLKTVRKLRGRRRERERLGLFVAEGEDLLQAADAAGWEPAERFAASGSGLPGTEVEPAVLRSVSELASGTRTLAVYRERWLDAAALAGTGGLCLYLHGLSDPANVGAVLRSAAAFGAACVVLGPGSADPFSPRAVRASMGAIFSVPVVAAAAGALPGVKLALDARAAHPLAVVARELEGAGAVSLMIGAERAGLGDELLELADRTARIPIRSESLNAAVAAAIAMYELSQDSNS